MPATYRAAVPRGLSHSLRLGALLLLTALLGAACSTAAPGPTSVATPTPTAQGPGPTQVPGTDAPAPTGQLPTPGSQPTPGGGGGGPTLPDGQWSAGNVHVVVSGDVSGTYDAPLVVGASFTAEGTTFLQYLVPDPLAQVTVTFDPVAVAISVVTAEWVGGAGTTSNSPCTATYSRADASAVDGTVACTGAPVVTNAGVAGQLANFQVSFTATR